MRSALTDDGRPPLEASGLKLEGRHLDQVVRGHPGEVGTAPGLIKSLWGGSKLSFLDKNMAT